MTSRGMARADFITGLAFMALGLAVLVESLRMPRFAELDVQAYTAPGLVPGLLGLVILLLGSVLFLRAARAGGRRSDGERVEEEAGGRRLLLSTLLCLGYAGGLVGRVPFWLATFLFVALFVIAFEWPLARTRAERMRRLGLAVLLAAVVSAAISYVFQEIFLVRLP